MVDLTEELKNGLGTALNESSLCGLEFHAEKKIAAATFAVRTLPECDGPPPEDPRVQIVFKPVGRLVASLRAGLWNDESAEVLPVEVEQLTDLIQELGCQPVYGWKFIDIPEDDWLSRVSLDLRFDGNGMHHTIDLFQEGAERHLDIRMWFDDLEVYSPTFELIPIEEFIAGGRRWWQALYARDPRLSDCDVVPLQPNKSTESN